MHVELKDALEFIYTDADAAKRPTQTMNLDVARGATGSVHLLLTGLTKGETLRLTVRRDNKAISTDKWFRLVDVPVEVNTGLVSFIERNGQINRFATRRAPFRVYDAMEPVGRLIKASSPIMALRLHLPIPGNAKPGRQTYTIEIQQDGKKGEKKVLSLGLNVHRAVIPAVGKDSFPYTNWFSLKLMAERHGLKPWSEAHWQMIRRYAGLMVHGRQNTFWIVLSDVFTLKNKMPVLNRERLRRIVRLFTAAGMHFIEGGHVAARTGGEWTAATFDIGLNTKVLATSAKGNALLASIAKQLVDEIDRNGWRERWIQHVTDEPVKENATDYRILVGMVRRHMPGLPIMDATMDPGLAGSVNIWCPQAQEYQRHRKEFEAQRALGDRIWFYTCCVPGGPWLNRLLDMELLRPALFGWGAALFKLDGFLHWGLNHYRPNQDPFKKSVVKHGNTNSLPAGDTHIVYPGSAGPWSSLRLESQREGFEDYELLRILQALDAKKANGIIRQVIRGFDKYTKKPNALLAARKAMLVALDRQTP